MAELFETLSRAMDGAAVPAIAASFVWGVLSLVLSPCHLSSIPLIIGWMAGGSPSTVGRAFRLTLFFSSGILVTLIGIGVATAALGRMLGDVGPWVSLPVALLLIWVGLHLMGAVPFPRLAVMNPRPGSRGGRGAFLVGLLFGLGVGPCTFAFLAPVLGVVFHTGRTDVVRGVSCLMAFSLGHVGVILLAGTFFEGVRRWLHWSENNRWLPWIRRVSGGLVSAAGLSLGYGSIRALGS